MATCDNFPQFDMSNWYDVSYLICSIIRYGYEYNDILNKNVSCTQIGSKISKSLVRIAATRIFSEPEQSILEIIVNSIDSYTLTDEKVGKFGMGFFSFLYWLIDHPDRDVRITSKYLDVSGRECEWTVYIKEIGGNLLFNLNINTNYMDRRGTTISLNANGDSWEESVPKFRNQIETKLSEIDSVNLDIFENNSYHIINKTKVKTDDHIDIILNSDLIRVSDYATGISLDTLLTSLLVPSISTKTISMSNRITRDIIAGPKTRIESSDKNLFTILVGNIGVVNLEFKTNSIEKYHIFIDLPISTRIPVTRDDILISRDSDISMLEKNLNKLVDDSINIYYNVYALKLALNNYSMYTQQSIIKSVIIKVLDRIASEIKKYGKIYVSYKYESIYRNIENTWLGNERIFILNDYTDVIEIENYLLQLDVWRDDLYFGKNVSFMKLVEDENYPITNFGTTRLLLIDTEFISKTKEWISNIPLMYNDDKLYTIDNMYSQSNNDRYNQLILDLDPKLRPFVYSLFLKFDAARNYFSIDPPTSTLINNINRLEKLLLEAKTKKEKLRIKVQLEENKIIAQDEHEKLLDQLSRLIDGFKFAQDINGVSYAIKYAVNLYYWININSVKKDTYGSGSNRLKIPPFNKAVGLSLVINYSLKSFAKDNFAIRSLKKLFEYNISYAFIEDLHLDTTNNAKNILKFSQQLMNNITRKKLSGRFYSVPGILNLLDPLIYYNKIYDTYFVATEPNRIFNKDISKIDNISIEFLAIYLLDKLIESTDQLEVYLFYLFVILALYITKNSLEKLSNHIDLIPSLIVYIKDTSLKYFGERFDEYIYQGIYTDDRKTGHIINSKYLKFMINAITIYLDRLTNINDIPYILYDSYRDNKLSIFEIGYEFTNTKLIEYVFKKDVDSSHFSDYFELISEYPYSKIPLQIIEIAVNEGTNKPYIEAMLTETIQNSIDAIRISKISNTNIDIKLEMVQDYDNTIMLSITDYVGIPDEGLLSMMIPFLSTKTASEIATGEMGSGFFNIYREADQVIINTINNGKEIYIIDIPVRDNMNRVIDIQKYVYMKNSFESNYTTISVLVKKNNIIEITNVITNIYTFVTNVLSLIDIENINITFNSNNILLDTTYLLESENFEFRSVNEKMLVNSYITTKGVPFLSLYDYFLPKGIISEELLKVISTNYVLNIRHGSYTPVQSRTSMNINDDLKDELTYFLLDSIYYAALIKYNNETDEKELDTYIHNTTSISSADQLTFNELDISIDNFPRMKKLNVFILNYIPTNQEYSLAHIINQMIKIMQDDIFGNKQYIIINNLYDYTEDYNIQQSVIKWLSNKNLSLTGEAKEKRKTALEKRIEEGKIYNLDILTYFTQKFVDTYWIIGTEGEESGQLLGTKFRLFKEPPIVEFKYNDDDRRGSYSPASHSITLNAMNLFPSYFDLNDFQNKLLNINEENIMVLNDIKEYKNLFGFKYPASTLIHELEHAWRNSYHSNHKGSHDSIELSIRNQETKTYPFNEAANEVFMWILQNNFYAFLSESMQ